MPLSPKRKQRLTPAITARLLLDHRREQMVALKSWEGALGYTKALAALKEVTQLKVVSER